MRSNLLKAGILLPVASLFLLARVAPNSADAAADESQDRVILRSKEPITPLEQSVGLSPVKTSLGRLLFNDTRLSSDNTISCASCHDLHKGGTDGLPLSLGVSKHRLKRNAPTVFNCSFNYRQFWDGRAATLEEQIDGPVNARDEMGTVWAQVLTKLRADAQLLATFRRIYNDGLTIANIKDSIAEFERSLITPDCRFDKYLRGDPASISGVELSGYKLFKTAGCISCHQGRMVGGNMMQAFGVIARQSEFNGLTQGRNIQPESMDGSQLSTGIKYKVPGLRNVAITGPYFHDGSAATLEEAVRIMGIQQLGRELTDNEVAELAAFLKTLTGRYKGKQL